MFMTYIAVYGGGAFVIEEQVVKHLLSPPFFFSQSPLFCLSPFNLVSSRSLA